MKKILIGVVAILSMYGCTSDVGRYQLYNDGAFMIDTKTGCVYKLSSIFDKEKNDYREYYEKMITEGEVYKIKTTKKKCLFPSQNIYYSPIYKIFQEAQDKGMTGDFNEFLDNCNDKFFVELLYNTLYSKEISILHLNLLYNILTENKTTKGNQIYIGTKERLHELLEKEPNKVYEKLIEYNLFNGNKNEFYEFIYNKGEGHYDDFVNNVNLCLTEIEKGHISFP